MTISLAAIEAADRAAGRAPWRYPYRNWPGVVMSPHGCLWNGRGQINDPADAELIALYRNASPKLAAAIRAVLALADDWALVGTGMVPVMVTVDFAVEQIRKAVTDAGVTP